MTFFLSGSMYGKEVPKPNLTFSGEKSLMKLSPIVLHSVRTRKRKEGRGRIARPLASISRTYTKHSSTYCDTPAGIGPAGSHTPALATSRMASTRELASLRTQRSAASCRATSADCAPLEGPPSPVEATTEERKARKRR